MENREHPVNVARVVCMFLRIGCAVAMLAVVGQNLHASAVTSMVGVAIACAEAALRIWWGDHLSLHYDKLSCTADILLGLMMAGYFLLEAGSWKLTAIGLIVFCGTSIAAISSYEAKRVRNSYYEHRLRSLVAVALWIQPGLVAVTASCWLAAEVIAMPYALLWAVPATIYAGLGTVTAYSIRP